MWGRYNNHSVDVWQRLSNCQWLIRRSGREVDDQVVKIAPFYVTNELLDGSEFDWTTPNNRRILVFEKERHGDDFHAKVSLSRMDTSTFDMQLATIEPHHLWNVRASDIDVENTHLVTLLCKSEGKAG